MSNREGCITLQQQHSNWDSHNVGSANDNRLLAFNWDVVPIEQFDATLWGASDVEIQGIEAEGGAPWSMSSTTPRTQTPHTKKHHKAAKHTHKISDIFTFHDKACNSTLQGVQATPTRIVDTIHHQYARCSSC